MPLPLTANEEALCHIGITNALEAAEFSLSCRDYKRLRHHLQQVQQLVDKLSPEQNSNQTDDAERLPIGVVIMKTDNIPEHRWVIFENEEEFGSGLSLCVGETLKGVVKAAAVWIGKQKK